MEKKLFIASSVLLLVPAIMIKAVTFFLENPIDLSNVAP